MTFSDETLMAYADGELDPVTRAEIEAAMVADPALRRTVERHRALAAKVKAAYQGVIEEPVPARLSSLTAAPVAAPVADLAMERTVRMQRKPRPAPRRLPQWAAMAASVALGAMVGAFLMRAPESPFETTAAGLVARGELDAALTRQLAGSVSTGETRIGISFRDRGGAWCRTFHVQHETPLAGFACRADDQWRVQVLAAAAPRADGMRAAAAMPMAVLQAVDAAIEGEALDAEAEQAARDAGWR